MSKSSIGTEPVYDARTLGKPRMFILGLQHMFAMFGATVLVPALSGLDVATTLLFAGIGTLLFHLLTKGKVPAFLGSSFAFIGGYNAVRTICTNSDGSAIYNYDLLAYACFGVAIAGLMYIILSTLFKIFGVKKVMRYFPPIVTGPIIIAIGLTLSSSAITNCRANWLVAVVAILIVIGFNMWGKGMAKIIPILLGVLGSYIFALIVDPAERASVAAAVSSAKWFGLPIFWKNSVFHLFAGPVDSGVLWSAVLTVVPLSLATMVEHIGDICAISSTSGTATEVTAFSIITDYQKGIKYPIADFEITPDVAIVDPELAHTMPKKLVAHTGMDAMTHAIEAYVSTANCDFTDPLALHAIEMIQADLVGSYNGDMDKRDAMHNAQCLAGMAFSNALLGIVHSMAHKTGAAFADYGAHIIHGAANAMYLPKVIAYNAKDPTAKARYGVIADKMHLGGENDDEKVALLIQYLRGMNDDLNIPHCIGHYGPDSYPAEQGFVPENVFLERLPEIAKNAIADACTGSNPRQPTQEEMEKLLKCCYYDTEVDF